jgi:adhesin transport system outer membrane protein
MIMKRGGKSMKGKIFVLFVFVLSLTCLLATAAFGQSEVRQYDVDSVLRNVTGGGAGTTLSTALQEAFTTNPTFLASKAEYSAARARYRKSFGALLPALNFSASASLRHVRNDGTISRFSGGSNEVVADEQKISLSQLIWDGGATMGNVAADELHADSKLKEAYNKAAEVALDATQYYLEVVRARGILELSRRNVDNHKQVLEMVSIRQRSGAGTKADVYQAEAGLAEAMSKQIHAEQSVRDAEANFANTFGALPGVLQLPGKEPSILPATIESGIGTALENNDALKAADLGIQQREKKLDSARGALLPSVSLRSSLGRSDNTSGFDESYHDASIGMYVNFTIFDGGSNRAAIAEARSLLRQAQFKREETRRAIEQDVRTAYNFMRATADLLPVLADNVDQNAKTLSSYLDQFRMGSRTLLDLLDAEKSLFVAEQALLNGKLAHTYSFYRTCLPLSTLLEVLQLEEVAKVEEE